MCSSDIQIRMDYLSTHSKIKYEAVGVNGLGICVKVKLQINYYFMTRRLLNIITPQKRSRLHDRGDVDILKTGKKITVQVFEGAYKGKVFKQA